MSAARKKTNEGPIKLDAALVTAELKRLQKKAERFTAPALKNVPKPVPKPIPGNRISMTNALTRAGHGLTLTEKRLVMAAVSKIDSKAVLPTDTVLRTRVYATEYASLFEVADNTAYEQLQLSAKQLFKRSITFYEPAERRRGKPLEATLVQMRWVGKVKYQKGEGWVELTWMPDLVKHLTGLRKQFTSYKLKQATALRTASSWKLLELLMRFKKNSIATYSIEDFCTAMDATEKQRADFGKIRTKIVEPAVNELNEKSDYNVSWEAVKAGRKVTALRFTFIPKTP